MMIESDIAFVERLPTLRRLGPSPLPFLGTGTESLHLDPTQVLFTANASADGADIIQQGSALPPKEAILQFFAEIIDHSCILAAQADRTVPRDVNANDAARLLLGVLLGIRVLARSTPNRSLLEGVARPALALLDVPRHNRKRTP